MKFLKNACMQNRFCCLSRLAALASPIKKFQAAVVPGWKSFFNLLAAASLQGRMQWVILLFIILILTESKNSVI